jgi:thiol-disulfide isomerase/thioredoxin
VGSRTPSPGSATAGRRSVLLLASVTALLLGAGRAGRAEADGAVHALLINGGDRPLSNYLSHRQHLEDMTAVLLRRGVSPERIHVFSADGAEDAADLASRQAPPPDFWLVEETALGKRLKPATELTNTRWDGVTVHPARRSALRQWFEAAGATIAPGDQLLIFVTDHGTSGKDDPDATAISLWQEKLSVREFKGLLALLPRRVRVVMVMSQCYSGGFASVIDDGASEPTGDVCGFFSTSASEKAYGCYPEGRDRDRIGHAFHFIDALGRTATTKAAHLEVLATDDTPDLPLRTTDAYLARLVSAEAAARKVDADTLVDVLLAQAWRQRGAWDAETRLLDRIAAAFGTASPRSLAELRTREAELEALAKKGGTYAERWQVALGELEESVVAGFLVAQPEWRARLDGGSAGQSALLTDFLPRFAEYARSRTDVWQNLEGFKDRAERGSQARWRLEVRSAAMRRMRTVLTDIAGRVLVGDAAAVAQRNAVERLESCEAFEPGRVPSTAPPAPAGASPSFPPLSADVATLEEISPTWLGVRFRAVPEAVRTSRHLPEGANFLDVIYPGSPAEKAGLQAGDIVLGPPAKPFESPRELREWTMTAPRGIPLPLLALRPGEDGQPDEPFQATLVLRADPVDLPALPAPPQTGQRAPDLPAALQAVGASAIPDLTGRPHLLFFWATWCGPCKQALPEVMALGAARDLPILAISDEDTETVARFVAAAEEGRFPSAVAVDPLRKAFISYGVSATPTIVLVDEGGVIRFRQIGYRPEKGLELDGWSRPPTPKTE